MKRHYLTFYPLFVNLSKKKAHALFTERRLKSPRQFAFLETYRTGQHRMLMVPSHNSRPIARRPFVIAPYTPNIQGLFIPARPSSGPCSSRDKQICVISFHHFRHRKTGPCFSLCVLRCRIHQYSFTLYPPGHVPYGRLCLVALSPDGTVDSERVQTTADFIGTFFDASLDAAQKKPWPRTSEGGSDRWWSTQGRRNQRAMALCAVALPLEKTLREKLAHLLSVAILFLLDQVAAVTKIPGFQSRGEAVRSVLALLSSAPPFWTYERLCISGHEVELWGDPWVWDDHIQRFRKSSFQLSEAYSDFLKKQARGPPFL